MTKQSIPVLLRKPEPKIPPLLAKPVPKSTIPPLLKKPPVTPVKKDPFSTNLNVLVPTGIPWKNQDSDWAGNKTAQTATASTGMIESLKNQARKWAADVVRLVNTPVPPMYAGEKNKLINTARVIKGTIEKVLQVDLPELKNAGLGVIPIVIGAAVVAGAAAAIVKWSSEYATLIAKVNNYNKMVSDGIPPMNAAQITQDISATAQTQTTMSKVVKYLPFVGAGVLLIIFKDKIFPKRSGD